MSLEAQIKQVTDPQIKKVLGLGLAQLYKEKPKFPINFLGNWLKQYCNIERNKVHAAQKKAQNLQNFNKLEQARKKQSQKQQKQITQQRQSRQSVQKQYEDKINKQKHLQDLLQQWLPEYLQKNYNMTGVYVGRLDYRKKPIEENNFQPGTQNDIQNPKIVTYIGASSSHASLMKGKVLENEQGRSYQIFQEVPEEGDQGQEGGQGAQRQKKNKFIYIDNVLNQPKLCYFKYPRLGAFACFSLKAKGYLTVNSFDKGVVDYKAYLKAKEQAEKQYQEKLTDARSQLEQAQKKCQNFDLNEEDPASVEQKKVLDEQAQLLQAKVKELQTNPPVVEEVVFESTAYQYFVSCDTLGQDKQIEEKTLETIEQKLQVFTEKWQNKQKQMLLADILAYLQDQPNLQTLENQYSEHQKNVINNFESQIKQQHQNRQKEGQFQFALIKCQKLRQLFEDSAFIASQQTYLNYNIPKYTEIVQIWTMLLGYAKQQINLPQSNQLNSRKIITKDFFDKLVKNLQQYQLKRQSSLDVATQYKITKLLERLQKIDIEVLAKYNGFLLLLLNVLKNYCWARILCRDAKKQQYQFKQKAKENRQAQIVKWEEDLQKALETHKAQLDEQGLQNFKEEDWMDGYNSQNPKPKPLEEPIYQEHLDIQ